MRSSNAQHPGAVLKSLIEEFGISRKELAERLGWEYQKVANLVNGNTSVTAKIAIQLAEAFGTTPMIWLTAQKSWELSEAMKKLRKNRKRIKPFKRLTKG
ncbi:MAG: addiction module antidote protein, HigA family [Flavobacterium sp.]|nr:MAG: addiction module antidote protein, HigA family [Flavobacterium sp.]